MIFQIIATKGWGVLQSAVLEVYIYFLQTTFWPTVKQFIHWIFYIVKAVPGIIARDTETLLLLHKLLLTDNYHREFADPDVLPIPWNDSVRHFDFLAHSLRCALCKAFILFCWWVLQKFITERKLRIGYYDDDGYFPSTPGVRRAVHLSRLRLQELGHELIPFAPPRVEEVVNSFTSLIGADRCKYLLEALYAHLFFNLFCNLWNIFFMNRDADDIDPVLKMAMVSTFSNHFEYLN